MVIVLPGDLTVFDVEWLSVWCVAFFVDFGNVNIPKNLNVPPSLRYVSNKMSFITNFGHMYFKQNLILFDTLHEKLLH